MTVSVRGRRGLLLTDHKQGSSPSGADNRTLIEQVQVLRRYARALVADPADADDLVQETIKRMLTYRQSAREIGNIRAYLLTVLHHVRADMLRRRHRAGEEIAVEDVALVAPDASPADRMMCQQVLDAVRRLPEDHRQIVLLIGLEGLSYRETADVLGIPIGTVMSRLSRARAALRSELGLRAFEPVLEVS